MCVSVIGFIIWTFPFQFFTTKPLPCDPSSLPKYPPCKEIDAKLRDEEERRYAFLWYYFYFLDTKGEIKWFDMNSLSLSCV